MVRLKITLGLTKWYWRAGDSTHLKYAWCKYNRNSNIYAVMTDDDYMSFVELDGIYGSELQAAEVTGWGTTHTGFVYVLDIEIDWDASSDRAFYIAGTQEKFLLTNTPAYA